MIKIQDYGTTVYHVISEPGDATRYDFLAFAHGADFMVVPYGSTFAFPHKMDRYLVTSVVRRLEDKEISFEDAYSRLDTGDHRINPNTVVQVARALYKLFVDGSSIKIEEV